MDQPEFKVGDRVVCVENYQADKYLSINHRYTITQVTNNGFVCVAPIHIRGGWYKSRFKHWTIPNTPLGKILYTKELVDGV